jgi:uncharacterized protein YhdP
MAFWPGSPQSFSLGLVSGSLALDIENGSVPAIEPGVGRAFAILNLDAVRRRLLFDFSDLYRKGFTFDRVRGSFVLGDGDAFTDDLTVKGPSARIVIRGRVGFVDRDYDELITVTPPVSASLSIAGAAAGGPAVGAALLVAQRLLGPQVDNITSYRYRVTGSWDDPKVERIGSGVAETGEAASSPEPVMHPVFDSD